MPALGGSQPVSVQYLDHSDERKSLEVFAGEITALSIAGFLSDMGDFTAALDGVTLGVRSRETWGERTYISNTPPASAAAQIETEVLVTYRGATTEAPYSFRIPTADYTAFNWVGDSAILTGAGASAQTTALIDAMVALMRAPDDETELIEVTGIFVVK